MHGLRAGVGTAIVAGIACGPLMPLNVTEGISQPMSGWLIRLGFFVAIAVVIGVGSGRLIELRPRVRLRRRLRRRTGEGPTAALDLRG
ncbi:MAG TPA: hypothetical protein VMO52_07075 [Acidimicrobiia bacterium]|nr:hypothetical protein [Acidimicrobiia bacterium]